MRPPPQLAPGLHLNFFSGWKFVSIDGLQEEIKVNRVNASYRPCSRDELVLSSPVYNVTMRGNSSRTELILQSIVFTYFFG